MISDITTSGMTELQQLRALLAAGQQSGIGATLKFASVEFEEGFAVLEGIPGEHAYNPMGTVHGGYTAALLDFACGCAVHSRLAAGQTYTTLELKVTGGHETAVRAFAIKQRPLHKDTFMPRSVSRLLAASTASALLLLTPVRYAAAAEVQDWIGTWGASPQPVWGSDFLFPTGIPRELRDQTVRQVARVSLGGRHVRVVLSNTYGDRPLVIGGAGIALARPDGTVDGPSKPLTFGGQVRVTVPPGAPITSDPVDLEVSALGSLAVSFYVPETTPTTTWHFEGTQTAVIADGNHVTDPTLKPAITVSSRLFLSEILVDAPADARALVPFGDSITDGTNSTRDANRRWPDVLAERLYAAGSTMSVVNEAISGARLLRDRMGDNALARFDRDVLSQPRAGTVVVMMGINDIGWPGTELAPKGEPAPRAADVVEAYRQLAFRAHARGLRIVGATLAPFEGALSSTPVHGYYDADKEAKRQAVNDFIRHGDAFDGVIDFDAVLRDPANPTRVRAAYDSGDHLHPNDAGYRAMAESIDLDVLQSAK